MLRTLFLSLLIAAAPIAYAADVSIANIAARAGTVFTVPVSVSLGSENANAIEGELAIPDGLEVVDIDTGGSPLVLWVQSPSYILADHAVEFTGGTPGGGLTGTETLFTLHLRAENPGQYTLTPSAFFAYRDDGKGTRVTLATSPVSIDVGTTAAPPATTTPASPPVRSPLVAQIGKDPLLFDGKYFATFYGGDTGSGIAYYEVQEGWWGRPVRADRYYVLSDQSLSTTLYVSAVDTNGSVTVTTVPAEHPLVERMLLGLFILVLGALGYLLVRFLSRIRS